MQAGMPTGVPVQMQMLLDSRAKQILESHTGEGVCIAGACVQQAF